MDDEFPIVLRMEARMPVSLGAMLMHAERKGGDLEHCEVDRRDQTIWYDEVGPHDFVKAVKDEIAKMSQSNLVNALEAMDKNRRFADHAKRKKEGVKPPYREAENGPLREVILTANAQYFYADPDDPDPYRAHRTTKDGDRETVYLSRNKIEAFNKRGLEFFAEHFPGQLRHLRLDMDEEVPHFHALIMVTKVTNSKRRGEQTNIVPSANPYIRNYEWAQNAAGEFFSTIGLVRGERRAEARRKAKELDNPAPEDREHVSPAEHRAERAEAIRQKEVDVEERLFEACQNLEEATQIADDAEVRAENTKQKAVEAADNIRQEADATRKEAKQEADEIRAKALRQKELNEQYIERYDDALEAGLAAVDDETIRYKPAVAKDQDDNLVFGSNAPQSKQDRNDLSATLRPALKVIKKYARRIWSSEAAQCERQFKADPSLVNVEVTYNPDAEPQSDDILKMDVKVSLDEIKGLSKPMKRILGGIANVIATQVGNAAIKLARSKLRDEFDALKAYRVQHRQQYGTVDPNAEAKMSLREQGLENMMAKAPDPRNAERHARQDRKAKGDKMDR
ncbi:hypothetical protein [uncultured Cohaesibacter sp.]|uniref:hypothetical protein n=1 Tax=uncultured Cohaesibacter sp. TaxID=1002546 RepID=UPI0029C7A0D3|nr:hypothetical protein [uncultured Cohaesibacter sp.]